MVENDDYEITDILTQYTDPDVAHLPWTDEDAWDHYPKHRWMYQKDDLIEYLNQEIPETDLWIHKPCINFWGLGREASVKIHPNASGGRFSMPFIEGDLYSTDFLISDGKFLGSMTFKTKNDPKDIHNKTLWEGVKTPSESLKTAIHGLITGKFSDFTGMLNIEYIDGYVIEMHLRPSAQFFWANSAITRDWINIMTGKETEFAPEDYSGAGYGSFVCRNKIDWFTVPDQVHVMRLNPSDDLAAVQKRQFLVSGPLALLRNLSISPSDSTHLVAQPSVN